MVSLEVSTWEYKKQQSFTAKLVLARYEETFTVQMPNSRTGLQERSTLLIAVIYANVL